MIKRTKCTLSRCGHGEGWRESAGWNPGQNVFSQVPWPPTFVSRAKSGQP